MKRLASFILIVFILAACRRIQIPVTIFSDGQSFTIVAEEAIPSIWLNQAGITLEENDRLFFLGSAIPADQALPERPAYTISVKRAIDITIQSPVGDRTIHSAALTVGEALQETGIELHAGDRIDPPANTSLPENLSSGSLVINYRPAQELFITVGGHEFSFLSTAETVGQALAEAGLPLVGLDQSSPPESAPLPQDGKIRIVRVSESVALTESSIPFGTHTEFSADLELDQQALLQGGEAGLKVARIRSRVEDGKQVSQTSDAESIVRPPKDRVMGIGTKVVIRTTEIDGDTVEYWRALTLYATPYHPCDAAGTCYYGTASGTKVRRGEVALVYPWYLLLAGERVYVPGYGFATIEDNNGANTSAYWGTYWIDLGYAQEDTIDWVNHYVTVYFLTPVPANIADLIVMP